MKMYLKIVWESFQQAWGSLTANKMRTFLSLLGITIGIFCIITVKSAVDSLEKNIQDGFKELGNDVIYLDRQPWNEDPDQNYWKYKRRPNPDYTDYEAVLRRSKLSDGAAYNVFTGGRTIKFRSNSVSNAFIMGSTYEYASIQNLKIQEGRYFTRTEYTSGSNKAILGNKLYNELFGGLNGVGKEVKLFGQDYQVIGYLESEGDNVFNFLNFDEVIWLGFKNISRYINTKDNSSVGNMLVIKASSGQSLDELKGDITQVIRANRRLKPLEKDNFSLNELSMLSQVIDGIFGVINIAGFIIGIFSLLVGMVSVANIMFVSVKERTSIIGIKKALGAKRYVILMEFLIESIVLCIFGGLIGLLLVWTALTLINLAIPFKMSISMINVLIGVSTSIFVGIIAGIIPAIQASGMDPVEAIRS
jgi:putative ABC transport system permease protein